jgi:VanZ family protein
VTFEMSSDGAQQGSPAGRAARTGPLKDIQLARLSRGVLDIPRRTRLLLTAAGLVGIALVAVESLVAGQPHTVYTDKILHFSGYAILALVFALAMRPRFCVPALIGLAAMGVVIEFLQTQTGRTYDLQDAYANATGVAVGGALGLSIRGLYSLVRRELATARVRRRLVSFAPGEVILREGESAERFFIIKSGRVRLSRDVDGGSQELAEMGPGEVVGALGVIRGAPQRSTVVALARTSVYGMDLEELVDSAGGPEQPVSTVLRTLTDRLREIAPGSTRARG